MKKAALFTACPILFFHDVGQHEAPAENLMVTPCFITWYTVGLHLH